MFARLSESIQCRKTSIQHSSNFMKTRSIKALFYFTFAAMAAFRVLAQNQIDWGTHQNISGDSDVSTSGTLVGTYSPYLIVNGGGSVTINGVAFGSNTLSAVASGLTNSTAMGINANLTDANYANLLSGAGDSTFDTPWSLTITNLIVGDSYQVEIWAENVNEPAYDQWENFFSISSSSESGAINYDENSSETGDGIGQYVIGTFTASNTTVQITSYAAGGSSSEWSEVWGSGSINNSSGQGQINLLQLRLVGAPAPQNQITWGSVVQISGDSDVVTNQSTLVGTYSPYLILNPGTSSLTVNGVTFQSNTLNAVTSGMTNSTGMGINANLTDANYANLLSGASDTPFNTSGAGYILFSNLVPGNEYEVELWAENINEPTYDQWENYWAVTTSDQSGAVNYDNNGSEAGAGIGEYVTGTFTPTVSNSVVQISWSEWSEVWGSGSVNSTSGQGQINLLQLRLLQLPPSMTQQPPALTYVPYSSNATVTAVAAGSLPLAYQWYETNLTAMTGFAVLNATNASLTLSDVTASDNYYLVVTNAYGSTNSAIASLVVYQLPVVVSQLPVTYTNLFVLYAGANPAFSVSALSVSTLGYQWFTNGVLDSAVTGSNLTLKAVPAGMMTNYCIVTNSYGSATSVVWTAAVIADPTNSNNGLAAYPQAVLALNPIGYWRMNDTNLDGPDNGQGDNGYICHDYAGGNDGIFTNMSLGNPGYNPIEDPSDPSAQFGQVDENSDYGDSEANSIAGINFSSPSGTSVAFTVEAWVNGYQPAYDGGIVTLGWGGGGEQFNLDTGASDPAHDFRFFIRDASGTVHDVNSTISPLFGTWYHLVGVVDEISNQNVAFYINGQSVGTASTASGSGILSSSYLMGIGSRMGSQNTNFNYQFDGNVNDVAIFNYALSPAQVAAEFVAGASNAAPFLVPAPQTNATANLAGPLSIPVAAYGAGPLGYEWINTNTSVVLASGTTSGNTLNASYATNSAPAAWNNQTLELVVTNAYGTTNVYVALTVLTNLPQFTLNLISPVTVARGEPYTYTVSATGAQPLGYQWYQGSTAISGQTGASYSPSTAVAGAYSYYAVATNSGGSATSVISSLIVLAPPTNAYAAAILSLNPVAYWPMHEVEAAAPGDIETNYGSLGLLGTGFYPDWENNDGQFAKLYPGPLASGDYSVFFTDPNKDQTTSSNCLYVARNSPLQTLTPPFTVECWTIQTNTYQGDVWSQNAFEGLNSGNAGGGSGNVEGIRLFWNGTSIILYTYFNVGGNNYPVIQVPAWNGQWFHLVVTCSATTNLTLYTNGVQAGLSTNAVGKYGVDSWAPFTVGSGRGDTRTFSEGAIGEVATYTNALSALDISNHYAAGINVSASPTYVQLVTNDNPTIYLRMNSPNYTLPAASLLPVLQNFGSASAAGFYTAGTLPGIMPGPVHANGTPVVGLSGTNVAMLSGVSSYADAGYSAWYNPTGAVPFTVAAMFRGNPDPDTFECIVGHSDLSWRIAMNSNGHLQSSFGQDSANVVNSTGVYNDGNWHQVVAVYQPGATPSATGTQSLYVDGQLDNAVSGTSVNGIYPGTNLDVFIAAAPDYTNSPAGVGRQFAGQVCEVALFTNALSAAQVAALSEIDAAVNPNPTNIVFGVTSNQLTLSWPANHTGWMLQVQTNSLSVGISGNWFDVAGSTATNQVIIPINLTNGSVFYRLVGP